MHRRAAAVELLQAVHADVAPAGARIVRDDGRERDERAAVARPAASAREAAPRSTSSPGEHDLLHGPALRRSSAASRRATSASGGPCTFSTRPCGGCISRTSATRAPRSSSVVDAERQAHAPLGAELVDQQRMRASPSGFSKRSAGPPAFTVRSTISVISRCGIDLGGDADELALASRGARSTRAGRRAGPRLESTGPTASREVAHERTVGSRLGSREAYEPACAAADQ